MGSSVQDIPPSINGRDRQRSSTSHNRAQLLERDFGGVAEMREPALIDWRLVRMCTDELDAVNLCIDLSRQKDEAISRALGIDKGHFSRIRKGMAHFPTAMRLALMRHCGNWAPLQYEVDASGLLPRLASEWMAAQSRQHPAASLGWEARA
jgi:hypothetical protein